MVWKKFVSSPRSKSYTNRFKLPNNGATSEAEIIIRIEELEDYYKQKYNIKKKYAARIGAAPSTAFMGIATYPNGKPKFTGNTEQEILNKMKKIVDAYIKILRI